MLYKFYAKDILDPENEANYSLREGITRAEYPQVHDYYEIFLATKGSFKVIINDKAFIIGKSQLVLAMPGDIHSKVSISKTPCQNINLAICKKTINELFEYLYHDTPEHILLPGHNIYEMSDNQKRSFAAEIHYFSLFRNTQKKEKRAELRRLLVPLFFDIIVPSCIQKQSLIIIPDWLQDLLKEMKKCDNLYEGLDYMIKYSQKTKEYICRSFRKYVGMTPIEFLNAQKLTYAANMLQHSNRSIVALSEDVGFSSLSYFYKQFKEEFGITPKKYREKFQSSSNGI